MAIKLLDTQHISSRPVCRMQKTWSPEIKTTGRMGVALCPPWRHTYVEPAGYATNHIFRSNAV